MQSTFSGIELAKRSLFAHSLALSTVGHNLSNASAQGYSRQRVELSATSPLNKSALNRAETPGQIGQGVDAKRLARIRDELLERRIIDANSGEGYWRTRDDYILQLEQLYNEPGELSIRSIMDRFWNSWQELSIYPNQLAPRQEVLETGQALVDGIRLRYEGLDSIRAQLSDEIQVNVARVNELSADIARLAREIVQASAAGDEANDLKDRRDLLIEELSLHIDITVDYRDVDEINVHTAGIQLIQGSSYKTLSLETNPQNEGFSRVIWNYSGEEAEFASGTLAALFELRDQDVRREIQNLDSMSVNFVDLVNEIHADAYGINAESNLNFFSQFSFVNNVNGNFDSNGDGAFDSSYIFRIRGSNALDPRQEIGLSGTIILNGPEAPVSIPYSPEDTVDDLILRINNSPAEVAAQLDRDHRLTLKATASESLGQPDFVLGQIEDTGQFLVGYSGILASSGQGSGYNFNQVDAVNALAASVNNTPEDFAVAPQIHPSAWLEINPAIREDPRSIASSFSNTSRAGELGDGRAALEIAGLRNQALGLGAVPNFDDYFADTAAFIGVKGQESEIALETQELIMKNLRDTRARISGVNIDEELAQMIKFQHGYNAASRYISTLNNMLDTIINRLGV